MAEDVNVENTEVESTPEISAEEAVQRMGDQAVKRIEMIAKMVKEYYRAIHGTINSLEFYQLGMDTIVAGLSLISRSNDMDELSVDERITTMNASLNTIIGLMNKVYLNPEVVANQVAQASIEAAKRKGVKI